MRGVYHLSEGLSGVDSGTYSHDEKHACSVYRTDIEGDREGMNHPIGALTVKRSVMKFFRRKRKNHLSEATHRRPLRDDDTLRSASLGSPIFVERWNGGSPLNWVEFMGSWENTRSDRPKPDPKD